VRRLEKLFRLPAGDRWLLARAAVTLGAARLALWVLPLRVARRLLARLGPSASLHDVPPERIGWAIRVTGRVVPRATCLPQALAAEALLAQGGHPAEFRIGVVKSERGRLEAHAWVVSGDRIVVGGLQEGLSRYTPLPPLPGPRG